MQFQILLGDNKAISALTFENEAGREGDDGGIPRSVSEVSAPGESIDSWAVIASHRRIRRQQ